MAELKSKRLDTIKHELEVLSMDEPDRESFPIPLKKFLDGDYLARADVALMRGKGVFSNAIRIATRSPFSHAALIFLVPHREVGFDKTFLIEAVTKGVQITPLNNSVKTTHAVAILRLVKPWFNKDVPAIVRGRMLDFINRGYDWRTAISLAISLTTGVFWGREHYSRTLRKSLQKAYTRGGLAPANFICSGFVQYGFLQAIYDLSSQSQPAVPANDVKYAIFNKKLKDLKPAEILTKSPELRAALLATTPEDISRAPQLRWKYLFLRDTVHRISSRDDAVALLK